MKKLRPVYDSGAVVRYHTARMIHPQTVASHAWGVATVLMWLYAPSLPRAELLRAALLHDVPEVFTGDTPATAKWSSKMLEEALENAERTAWDVLGMPDGVEYGLTEHERAVLKFCDMAELVAHCLSEARMGNRFALDIANRGLDVCGDRAEALDTELRTRAARLTISMIGQARELS